MTDIDGTTFAREVKQAGSGLSPARAGLLFAREIVYPELLPSTAMRLLEDLAAESRRAVAAHYSPEARGIGLAEYLFDTAGFRGNTTR